ncbi:DUF2490 domain-containing protein [Hymenobacter taeanensis]|uniref:DUF2490 domain-containing protein n=1 Tax=Hymenobacter taeanensis TaxID=2735321 RepID=A0A6M6BDC6_9BACT|nr:MULTISPECIES: DUF2490 domain-containing protein [Hymenobacter]QJX45838.1 DUF2490 domain-containing protein [Hymenobacter taeanensis]UOQ79681.1 DUF2490 domain-containing protein [Hymenobacter sp. 5414T-23]
MSRHNLLGHCGRYTAPGIRWPQLSVSLCVVTSSRFWGWVWLVGCLCGGKALAQTAPPERVTDRNHNAWLTYFSDARLSQRWGLHTEFQYRRTNGLQDPQQYLYRIGGNYHATEQLLVSGGYAYLLSLPYGDFPDAGRSHERRVYVRAELENTLGRLTLAHRYTQEQRWLRDPGEAAYAFQNRSRYRLQLQFPLTGPKLEAGTLYALASDEIFISYGRNVGANVFNQNRLYGGLGYQITEALGVETSYLRQTVQHDDGVVFEQNHTLQISLNFNPDFRPATER